MHLYVQRIWEKHAQSTDLKSNLQLLKFIDLIALIKKKPKSPDQ